MSKKGKLSNQEKYIILGMVQQDKTLQDITKELNRSEDVVIDYLADTAQKAEKVTKVEPQPAPKPEKPTAEQRLAKMKAKQRSKVKSRFRRMSQQDGSTKKGVSIMSGPKSMLTDEMKKQVPANKGQSRLAKGAIYRIDTQTTE